MAQTDTNQPPADQPAGETPPEEVRRLREAVLAWLEKTTASKPHQTSPQTQAPAAPAPTKRVEPPAKAGRADVTLKPTGAPTAKSAGLCPAVEKPKRANSPRGAWRRTVGLVAGGATAGLLLAVVVFGLLLYQFKWQSGWVATLTRIIPYPVAIVNYRPLPYHEWQQQVATLHQFYLREKDQNPELEIPTLQQTQQHILNRMVEQVLLEELAQRYNLTVTDQEIAQHTATLIREIGGEQTLVEQLHKLYGWTIADFQKTILRSVLLKNKLKLALTLDERINPDVRQRAEQVLNLVRTSGRDFADLAAEYSEDVTAVQGGDLGYFSPGQMVPMFEAAAVALEPGQVSDLVKTGFGYHIIKLEEKLTDEAGTVTQLRARHILLRTQSLDEYLQQMKQSAALWQLVNL